MLNVPAWFVQLSCANRLSRLNCVLKLPDHTVRVLNRFIAGAPFVVAVLLPLGLSAATVRQGVELANSIGLQSGKLYCSGKSARDSIEKGTAKAMSDSSISMDEISSIDFSEDVYSVPMIESFFAYTIDNCPARAKRLWREITESM